MRALVIEDDPGIASVLRRSLEADGWEVHNQYNGKAGLDSALEGGYNIILLDIMLPGMDGFQVCKHLRLMKSRIPVLMLTAKDSTADKVVGLDLGADDYLAKPFELDELMARIRALVRRDKVHRARIIKVHDLEIDSGSRRATRAGTELALSRREFDLLEALAGKEGRVLTRDIIQNVVWASEPTYSNNVDAFIKLLRKKVDSDHDVKLIQTVRGVGYTLRGPE